MMATSTLQTRDVREALRNAVSRAVLAPSVHNTQPWLWRLVGTRLELCADRSRQLRVLDPTGRQLLISCGCALFNARVQLAAHGYQPRVQRYPDSEDPDLLATISAVPQGQSLDIRNLSTMVGVRQTNRRQFTDDAVEPRAIAELCAAAAVEETELFEIRREEHRIVTAVLSQKADREENGNPAYRAELRAWTSDDPKRRDGVPATAVPHVDADAEDDIPIRDFDTRGAGWLPTKTRSSLRQCLLLLCVQEDTPAAWLRAGEALERVWLEATRLGYAISLFTQVVEVPSTRDVLRAELGLASHPVVLLRVGRAPMTSSSHRRRIDDVLVERP
jgi:nitroreductase